MKKHSRRQFIKLGSLASATMLLEACGLNSGGEKKGNPDESINSVIQKIQEPAPAMPALIGKEDKRYDMLRKGFNKRIDHYPLQIALCTSTEEVAAAIRYANKNKLAIAVKSGGHSMEGFSCNTGGMVINLSKMNKVVLLENDHIKAGPGCTLSGLYDAILPSGRILPAGSCATVGLGGLTLGGGYGLFSRQYGLTCDHLIEATMVDGNGNIHSTKNDMELLWALKGGGAGNFGVVTELVFKSQPAPTFMQGHYFKARHLSAERASSILKTWMAWSVNLPATCFSGYVLNGSTLNIVVTNYEPQHKGLQLQLAELESLMDEFHSSKVGKLNKMLSNHYGAKSPIFFRNSSAGLFSDYKEVSGFITEIFEKIIANPGMIYQVNTLGGKIKDPNFEKLSSYPHRDFDFISELQAYWEKPQHDKVLALITTEILDLISQQGIKAQYVNYCSLGFMDWQQAYYGKNYERLQNIKRKYDPADHIRHPQSVRI